MQLTMIVPIVAMVIWKLPSCGYCLCFVLIAFNAVYNMAMTNKYDLKIGLVNVHNYRLLQAIIAKPWSHF